ncbi:glycosyltransferase family 4 protein [Halococcus qingdaonensis]|uniref:glycosyltransferase family 4 protein n=1 Tax=Halococcus qingdaonensis TaxID=224402 RepID=UPI0021162D79|nr:glycosyltransferase family 4 protein [Halococcus qingdaonensis]
MHVLYSLSSFPKLSESFVLNEIDELTRRGHDVSVFSYHNPNDKIHHEEHQHLGVPVRYAEQTTISDAPKLVTSELLNSRVLGRSLYYDHPKDHIRTLNFARQHIEFVDDLDKPIDHIHSHFARRDKIAATYAAAHFGVSCTVTAHAYGLFADPDPHELGILFDRTDRVIVPSRYNRSYLRKQFGVTRPIDVVPATARVSKFEPTDREVPNRLLTVARLVEKKGIIYAIEAVARLAETNPDTEYHIVGTGEREEMLRQRADELGVADRVTFLGNVSDERLRQEYDEAAAFILPCVIATDGDRDGSPVAIKEAMAMETPCISTTVTGIPEMIDDETNGLLVEPRDADALAEAIATMLADANARMEMGHNARETIREKFGLEIAVEKLLSSFQKSIQ